MIHPSAIIEPGAKLGENVTVGPFSLIGPEVTLGDGVVVKSHAVVTGWTEVGPGTVIFPHATVGEVPQDLKYKGERTRLIVGARNRIREGATLNLGTEGGGGVTRVGDDNLFMWAMTAWWATASSWPIAPPSPAIATSATMSSSAALPAYTNGCGWGRGPSSAP